MSLSQRWGSVVIGAGPERCPVSRGCESPYRQDCGMDVEIHNEIGDELIAWRSLESADINNAGPARFRSLPNGPTEVKVVMR